MKIALFTYFAADNYGATLQAYSTIKALESLGHEVEIVNYVIPEPDRSVLKKILLYPKHLKFNSFRKKYFPCLSRYYASYDELVKDPPKADCYLIGSDQTWNADISKQWAKGYFLDFGSKNILRGSYSASIGKTVWEDTEWIRKADVQRGLDRFDFLSIRELSGKALLKEEFGKDAVQVLDPVLLFSSYSELTGDLSAENELITYKLINSDKFYEQVRLATGLLDVIPRSIGSIRQIPGFKHSYPESIEKWIKRFASAKYVITDSFHGTVISIIYHRPFAFCIGNPKRATRIFSLLKLLNLEDRYVDNYSTVEDINGVLTAQIDWAKVDEKLKEMRELSFDFLKQNIKSE